MRRGRRQLRDEFLNPWFISNGAGFAPEILNLGSVLTPHRCHDYKFLIQQWKSEARQLGLRCRSYSEIDGFPLYLLETRQPQPERKNIYLSTGIHGDEPAAPAGLLAWCKTSAAALARANFTILPCLNPWGIINNTRADAQGHDLNRTFHEDAIPAIRELKTIIRQKTYDLSLTLHEDFDGEGAYLYEVDRGDGIWSPDLLQAVGKVITIEPRKTIDRFRISGPGYIRRNARQRRRVQGPEALFLFQQDCQRVFTFETPSEFDLPVRIAAHVALIRRALEKTLETHGRLVKDSRAGREAAKVALP